MGTAVSRRIQSFTEEVRAYTQIMRKAIICGAGIAGLTASWWLAKDGWDVLLLEKAPSLRDDGYMIDFFSSGYDVAERMGLIPRLQEAAYKVPSIDWVDKNGKRQAGFDYDLFSKLQKGRVLSFLRGDLERALFDLLPNSVDIRFATSVSKIECIDGLVGVTLTSGERAAADLLIGAGGVHSTVRAQIFGAEENYFRYLGYHVAAYIFESEKISAELQGRFLLHTIPKRQVGLYAIRGGRIASFFVHADPDPTLPASPQIRLNEVYGDMGWLIPEALKSAEGAEIYYDQVAQIEMDDWVKERAVMLGDAAYAVSLLAGQGASLAMGGAYVLAEELRNTGDVDRGLRRFEARLKPAIAKKQAAGRNAAKWFVPEDALHLVMRNWAMRFASLPCMGFLMAPVLKAGSESVVE